MCKFPNGDFAFGDQGASPLEPDRQGAGAEYLRAGKTGTVFPPGGGALMETGMERTGAAHRSGRHKACFFALMDYSKYVNCKTICMLLFKSLLKR